LPANARFAAYLRSYPQSYPQPVDNMLESLHFDAAYTGHTPETGDKSCLW
jgi:hypothetical protein